MDRQAQAFFGYGNAAACRMHRLGPSLVSLVQAYSSTLILFSHTTSQGKKLAC